MPATSSVRTAPAQRVDQRGAVQVAGRLAGDQQDAQRRAHARLQRGADALGDLHRADRGDAVDQRRRARAHGVDEGLDLVEQRIGVAEVLLARRRSSACAPFVAGHAPVDADERSP